MKICQQLNVEACKLISWLSVTKLFVYIDVKYIAYCEYDDLQINLRPFQYIRFIRVAVFRDNFYSKLNLLQRLRMFRIIIQESESNWFSRENAFPKYRYNKSFVIKAILVTFP